MLFYALYDSFPSSKLIKAIADYIKDALNAFDFEWNSSVIKVLHALSS